MFWAYFEMTVFPLLLLEVRGFFSSLHGDESGGACGDTLMEVWIPQPKTGPPCFKLSNLSTLNLQQLISYCLGFSTLVLVPTEVCDLVNCDSLYLHVCLFSFEGSGLLWDLSSLLDLGRVVDFRFS